jgi:hypothetical protein
MPYKVLHVRFNPPNGWIQTDACSSEMDVGAYFPTASVIIHIMIELVAAYLAFGVRGVHSRYNESKTVGLIAYNWILFGGVLYPIGQVRLKRVLLCNE